MAADEVLEEGAAHVRLLVAPHATLPTLVWSALFYDTSRRPIGLAVIGGGQAGDATTEGQTRAHEAAEGWLAENRHQLRRLYDEAKARQVGWRGRILAECAAAAG